MPTFTYIALPLDHTEGVSPGKRTPDADIANNDYALGPDRPGDLAFQGLEQLPDPGPEDDSQDGADHVDAHRMPALAISPYTRRGRSSTPLRPALDAAHAEIIMGLKPLNLAEALAVPMYDAFSNPAANSRPYNAIVPNVNMTAHEPGDRRRTSPAAKDLPLDATDQVPQQPPRRDPLALPARLRLHATAARADASPRTARGWTTSPLTSTASGASSDGCRGVPR